MAVQVFFGSAAIGATEQSLTTNTTGPDVQTLPGDYVLVLDLSDMVALDDLRIRVYDKVIEGGTQRVMHEWPLVHPQPPVWVMQHPLPLIHGWEMTAYAAVGTVNLDWSIRAMGSFRLEEMTELAAGSPTYYRWKASSLEQSPSGGSAPSAATIADAVWDEARAGHVAGGSFGEGVASVTGAVGSVATGGITAASLAADTITAAKLAADVTTELQSGLATAAALDTVDNFLDTEVAAILAAVDTEVAAIKAKTDSLTFTVAGQVDANIQYVNDTQIQGTGAVGSDEWRKV